MNYNNNDNIFNSVLNPCIIDAYINKHIISHKYLSLVSFFFSSRCNTFQN